jgi:hypothetical protein
MQRLARDDRIYTYVQLVQARAQGLGVEALLAADKGGPDTTEADIRASNIKLLKSALDAGERARKARLDSAEDTARLRAASPPMGEAPDLSDHSADDESDGEVEEGGGMRPDLS